MKSVGETVLPLENEQELQTLFRPVQNEAARLTAPARRRQRHTRHCLHLSTVGGPAAFERTSSVNVLFILRCSYLFPSASLVAFGRRVETTASAVR